MFEIPPRDPAAALCPWEFFRKDSSTAVSTKSYQFLEGLFFIHSSGYYTAVVCFWDFQKHHLIFIYIYMSEYPRGYSKPMFPQVNYNYKITYTQSHKLEPFHFQSRAVSTLLQSKKIFLNLPIIHRISDPYWPILIHLGQKNVKAQPI